MSNLEVMRRVLRCAIAKNDRRQTNDWMSGELKMSRKSTRASTRTKSTRATASIIRRKRKADEIEDEDRSMAVNKRRQQFQIQNHWVPILDDASSINTCILIPSKHTLTPEDNDNDHHRQSRTPSEILSGSQFRFQNYFTTPVSQRFSPLPTFSWADSKEVWTNMMKKDFIYVRDPLLIDKHPMLQCKMRSILLDWLTEVCEVYRLHRETFHLAVDYIDRYLSTSRNVLKHQLQLIGITSLFIAAKLEEIYPPKLAEFAYVTDGACTENEILDQELVMLKALDWDLSPMTVNSWLNIYLQVANMNEISDVENGFVFPQYSSHTFVQIARLMDLCTLDTGALSFPYSILAATGLYHMSSPEVSQAVSGFTWDDMLACVQWMAPFAVTIREAGSTELKFFPNISPEDYHNIQTHSVDLTMLERVQSRQNSISESSRSSPDITTEITGILTPPQSRKKDVDDNSRTHDENRRNSVGVS